MSAKKAAPDPWARYRLRHGIKKCTKCKAVLLLDAFYADPAGKINSQCRSCVAEYQSKLFKKRYVPHPKEPKPPVELPPRLVCSGCKVELPIENFKPRPPGEGGCRKKCIACQDEKRRAYYLANKKKINARTGARQKKPEVRALANAKARVKYRENPEVHRSDAREQYLRHAEKYREKSRAAYAKDPDTARLKSREYQRKNREVLTDGNIRATLTHRSNLKAADIPQFLVEIERIRHQLKRAIREQL